MTRHLLIAGHGLLPNGAMDTGATGHISKGEHRYMKEDLFPAMQKYTKDSDDTFIFHSAYKVLNRGNLAELAKQHNADTVTEFHYDSFRENSRGGHIIVHESFEPDKLDLRIRDVIEDMIGLRFSHRGHQGVDGRTNLGMINTAASNGINFRLVELGFGSNKQEADILINDVDEYAKKLVQAYDVELDTSKPSTPKKSETPKKQENTGEYTGGSVVDYLVSIGEDGSFSSRQRLARQHGISNYSGTASQNTTLLNSLRRNGLNPTNKSTQSSNYTGGSIVDYLISIKEDSSFSNRARLASQNGIRNYSGTAQQNIQLLNKLQGSSGSSTPSYVGRRVESIHNGDLRFYNRNSWEDRHVAGTITRGYGFPNIIKKESNGQYRVKNSSGQTFWITASSKYVRVV